MAESKLGVPEPQERYNALIRPSDDDWKAVHDNFKDLLAQPTLRTEDILGLYFTTQERKLFLTATEPRSLRDCQESNTRRYWSLIAGRFKDCHLSFATKLTMLYFGLPVEPIMSLLFQYAKPDFDVDDGDEMCDVEIRPPLHFLTAHNHRNYGHDHMRGAEASFTTLAVPDSQMPENIATQGLSLRGGGYDDDGDDLEMRDAGSLSHTRTSAFAGQRQLPEIVEALDDDFEEDDVRGNLTMTGLAHPDRGTRVSGPGVGHQHPAASSIRQTPGPRANVVSVSGSTASRPTMRARFDQQQAAARRVDECVPLYGYQGRIMFKPDDLSTFEAASRKLLSLRQCDACDLVLVEFDRSSRRVTKHLNDSIPLKPNGAVTNRMRQQAKSDLNCAWFVLRVGESKPAEWEPKDSCFSTSLIKLRQADDEGHENVSYCNIPSRELYFDPKPTGSRYPSPKPWGVNQYMPFLTTAQQVLVGTPDRPSANHFDIIISSEHGGTGTFSTHWYGGIEVHRRLLDMMHPVFAKGKPFEVETHPLPENSVVFYLPGGVTSSATALKDRECRRQSGSGDHYPSALEKVNVMTRGLTLHPNISYRLWRGVDYFNPMIKNPSGDHKPVSWNPRDFTVQNHAQLQGALSNFIANSVDNRREPCRLFVIQPFNGSGDTCIIETPDEKNGSAEFQVSSDTMDKFRARVQLLYEHDARVQFDPQQDSILLEPIFENGSSGQWNPVHFVLRPDAPDWELVMVQRLSVAKTMRVTIWKNDELNFVKSVASELDTRSQWGPRYGQVTPLRPELSLPTIAQPVWSQPVAAQTRPGEASRAKSKAPEEDLRKRSWATQPSVYDNGIYHPSFPINAPPVESILRTGGSRVPMITKNVLTATEQHEMQGTLWNTRNLVLDRICKCPYQGCNVTYRMEEEQNLVKHLEEKHAGQKCPWCDLQLFQFWSGKQKEEHYKSAHAEQLRKILEQPQKLSSRPQTLRTSTPGRPLKHAAPLTPPLSSFKIMERTRFPAGPLPRPGPPPKANEKESDYRYCDRCGRDHIQLSSRTEREHHDRVCVPLAEGAGLCTFCEACGHREWKTGQDAKEFAPFDEYPHKCRGTIHQNKPHCTKCGLSLKKMTDESIDRHRTYCAGYYGTMGCFCPYCQHHFVEDKRQKPIDSVKKHIFECDKRDPMKATPYEIYPETYWEDKDVLTDPLYVGQGASTALVRKQRRPNEPTRYLSYPLMWHERPGPTPTQDPPSECKLPGCREPLFGLTPSEILGHFETNHGGRPQRKCPLCHLSFERPEDGREDNPESGEWEDRRDQVAHMECHVYQLWDVLTEKGPPPPIVNREPFYAGHSLWDPDNERALDRRDKRCPHFDKCGAMVGFMNQKQWNQHMEIAHAAEDFEPRVPRDIKIDLQAAFEERKQQRIREGKHPMVGQVPPVLKSKGLEPGLGQGVTAGQKPATAGPAVQPQGQAGARGGLAGGQGLDTVPGQGLDPEGTRPKEDDVPRGVRPEGAHPQVRPETQTTSEPKQKSGTALKPKTTVGKIGKHTGNTGKPPGKPDSKPAPGQKSFSGTNPKIKAPAQSFDAEDNMYCSRCFRKAPNRVSKAKIPEGDPSRQEQIDAHSDPTRSCRIRPQEGRVRFSRDGEPILPSRVGWIRKGNLKLNEIRDGFVRSNPELERTMCPTDMHWKRPWSRWVHDPNNENNDDVWGMPYKRQKDRGDDDSEEDDGEEDYVVVDNEEDDDDEETGEAEDEDKEKEEDDEEGDDGGDGAKDNSGTIRKKKRKQFRGFQPHDPTYRYSGDEDSVSEDDPSGLVPESEGEGEGSTGSGGGKRKRDATEPSGQGQAGKKKKKTQEQERKKAGGSEEAQGSKS
ncbi:Putative Zinc finger C2H2-type [Colletotrichum destructivum]|uniref:Zinc finger C2H2-type n=1 Tax=Colletotrichum destructivum TaxID=34406 RepID=A0AAX4IXB3_9PEZI|nr:Putative Zinc finger C2H2-type [Colletotrichum destructivum]